MHACGSRRIFIGLSREASPISAPYGHIYRHQKFWITTDSATSTTKTPIPTGPSVLKRFSIFTSATIPYGELIKSSSAAADIVAIANTKNPSSTYFSPRSPRSSHRGTVKFRPKTFRPSFHKYSETVPTGHSHEQKAFFSATLISRNAISKNIAAGCIAGTFPVTSQYFKFINPAIGSHPSTPVGRPTGDPGPRISSHRTHT